MRISENYNKIYIRLLCHIPEDQNPLCEISLETLYYISAAGSCVLRYRTKICSSSKM